MADYRIIHIEDNPVFTDLTQILIQEIEGINIDYIPAHTANKAYSLLETNVPDILIADLMLENEYDARSGLAFIKKVKEKYPKLQIMVLTARGDNSLREELEDTVIRYETKTFRPSSFKDLIKDLLTGVDENE